MQSDPRDAPAAVPLWYRLLRPIRPDRSRSGTMGTRGTLRDASTLIGCRLGAERSGSNPIAPTRWVGWSCVPAVPRVPISLFGDTALHGERYFEPEPQGAFELSLGWVEERSGSA